MMVKSVFFEKKHLQKYSKMRGWSQPDQFGSQGRVPVSHSVVKPHWLAVLEKKSEDFQLKSFPMATRPNGNLRTSNLEMLDFFV